MAVHPSGRSPPPASPARALRWLDVRGHFRQWLQDRLPHSDTWTLGQRNIYILPTPAGFTFALTLVVMLLASINYQLNLGYALTFLLAGAALVSMHMTHGNLRGLTLHLRPPSPGFAGDAALLEVVLTNPGRQRYGLALRFDGPGRPEGPRAWTDAPAGGQAQLHLSLVPPHRGWQPVPTVVVDTIFPFGLFRAWTVWRPASRVLAWPRPESPLPPLPGMASAAGERPERRSHGSELDGVRPWRRGDTMRQVAWKKVARSGELVSRETSGSARRELWLHWADAGTGGDVEQRLSRLTGWLLRADQEGLTYGLRLPGQELELGQGDSHRRRALERLALWS
jgi:uncharacterized protein (DUF58 family)